MLFSLRRPLFPAFLFAALLALSSCDTSSAAVGSQKAPAALGKKKPAPRPDAGVHAPDAGQHGSGSQSGGTPPRAYR